MPIYEYVCRNCGSELERLQRLADAPLTDCPECNEAALKRKVSAAGFRLSGGGWYETDFKSDGKRNIAGEKSDSSGGKSNGAKEKSASGDAKSGSSAKSAKSAKSDSAAAKPARSGQASGSTT